MYKKIHLGNVWYDKTIHAACKHNSWKASSASQKFECTRDADKVNCLKCRKIVKIRQEHNKK